VALNDLARTMIGDGRLDDAVRPRDEAIALLRELGDKPMLADALGSRALAALADHDLQTAITAATEERAIADEIHNDWGRSFADMNLSRARAETGDLGAGIELGESCVAFGDRAGFLIAQVGMRAELGRAYWEAGDPVRATDHLHAGLRIAERKGSTLARWAAADGLYIALQSEDQAATEGWRALMEQCERDFGREGQDVQVLGQVALELLAGEHGAAAARARAIRESQERKGFSAIVGDWYWLEAEALRRGGKIGDAQRVLESGLADYREHRMHRSYWQLARTLLRIARAEGDAALAERVRKESEGSREIIARSLVPLGLRDAFLSDVRPPPLARAPAATPVR
jgi:hypothetical protein